MFVEQSFFNLVNLLCTPNFYVESELAMYCSLYHHSVLYCGGGPMDHCIFFSLQLASDS